MSSGPETSVAVATLNEVTAHEHSELGVRLDSSLSIALSGGGIRSAAFCLGALEALERIRVGTPPERPSRGDGTSLIDHVHAVSSVSGGGFTAALWAYLLEKGWRWDSPDARDKIARARARASYLAPGAFLGPNGMFEGLAAYGMGLALNLALVFGLSGVSVCAYALFAQLVAFRVPLAPGPLGAAMALVASAFAVIVSFWPERWLDARERAGFTWGGVAAAAVCVALGVLLQVDGGPLVVPRQDAWRAIDAIVGLAVLVSTASGAVTFLGVGGIDGDATERRVRRRRRLMTALMLVGVLAILSLETWLDPLGLQPGSRGVFRHVEQGLANPALQAALASLGGASALISGAFAAVQRLRESPGVARPFLAIAVQALAVGAVVLIGVFHGAFLEWWAPPGEELRAILLHAAACVLLTLGATWLNVFAFDGATTTHHLFRDRIAAAFFPPDAVDAGDVALKRPLRKLSYFARPDRPLWIINAALNSPERKSGELKRPKAQRFELTPLYCGASGTDYGFVRTSRFGFDHSPAVMQAVTTSAAVVAPQMGDYSKFWVWMVANVLNLRLGQVARRPATKPTSWADARASKTAALALDWPDLDVTPTGPETKPTSLGNRVRARGAEVGKRFVEGLRKLGRRLARMLLGLGGPGRSEIYLTDGGHYDNLGLLALVERRASFILAIDAEADGDYAFKGLADVVRRARTDHRATIEIDTSAMRPDAERRSCHAVGRVRYDGGGEGWLLYLKPVLSSDVPLDVRNYATLNPTFPHETTANQFFSSSQFEAYRRLGDRALSSAIDPAHELLAARWRDAWGRPHPRALLEGLFEALAEGVGVSRPHSIEASRAWVELLTGGATYSTMRAAFLDRLAKDAGLSPHAMRGALTIFQHMEDVFTQQDLGAAPRSPQSAGWIAVFREYGKSDDLRRAWRTSRHLYSLPFREFCRLHLTDLDRDP